MYNMNNIDNMDNMDNMDNGYFIALYLIELVTNFLDILVLHVLLSVNNIHILHHHI